MNKYITYLLAAFLQLVLATSYVHAEENDFLTIGAGAFEIFDGNDEEFVGNVAYRFSPRFFSDSFGTKFRGFGPSIGFFATTENSFYGHFDIFADIRPTENIVIWPSVGVGGYRQGDGPDLGGVLEFHTEVFIGYRFSERHMLGLSVQHISNAGTHDINPGANLLLLNYTVALPALF